MEPKDYRQTSNTKFNDLQDYLAILNVARI